MITALNKINIKCLFFLIHFVLIACNNEKCGNVVGDNCNISEENFLLVTPLMKKKDLIQLFGPPDSYSPPNVGLINVERLLWYRYSYIYRPDVENIVIFIDLKNDSIIQKKIDTIK